MIFIVFCSLMMGAAASDRFFVLERSIVGLLLLTGRLMRREDVAPIVLQSLRMLLLLKPQVCKNNFGFVFRLVINTIFCSNTDSVESVSPSIVRASRTPKNRCS